MVSRVLTASYAELPQNVVYVILDRPYFDDEAAGNLLVGQAGPDQFKHLELPPGQRGDFQACPGLTDQLGLSGNP